MKLLLSGKQKQEFYNKDTLIAKDLDTGSLPSPLPFPPPSLPPAPHPRSPPLLSHRWSSSPPGNPPAPHSTNDDEKENGAAKYVSDQPGPDAFIIISHFKMSVDGRRAKVRVKDLTLGIYETVIDDTVSRIKAEFVQEGVDE